MTCLRNLLILCASPAFTALLGCGHPAQSAPPATASRKSLEASAPVVKTVRVSAHPLDVTITLPGELQPYQAVAIYPKLTAFVQWIGVDRGSKVRQGQLLAKLVAPELVSQRAEAQAKVSSAASRTVEAAEKTASDEATFERLKVANQTPGVIAENELQISQQAVAGDRARQQALGQNVEAVRATLRSVEQTGAYLNITAPFDGVVTARNVHPGALVGPGTGGSASTPMLNIAQISHLRLTVDVPEAAVAYIHQGADVGFTVASYPNQTFHGKVARLAESLDVKTRTMPVELDVDNAPGGLTPGMFAQVIWPEHRDEPTLFVPASAVVRSMEATFVVRIQNGETEWVPVKPGVTSGEQVQVFGDLREGDAVALRGTEELRPKTKVVSQPCDQTPCAGER